MRTAFTRLVMLLCAVVLASCGGSGAPTFKAVVVFGDSLSDVGAYAPATSATGNGQPPYVGGKFTTNSATGTVWVENIATALGLSITPYEVGYAGQSVTCPSNDGTCTGYAQGGSRVTNPAGIGNDSGALTRPMVTQIANHLSRFGSFKSTDLIFVYGGNNDAFVQLATFGAAVQGGATTDAALALTVGAMQTAATELVGYVKNQVLANGGAYVVVSNLPNSVYTPFGQTLDSNGKAVLTTLVNAFNQTLAAGLAGTSVLLLDSNTLYKQAYDNPSAYGITNNTETACDPDKISTLTGGVVTSGTSLFCNSTAGSPLNTLRDGASALTWQFADGVHPSTGGHKLISDQTLQFLRANGLY